VSQSALDWNYRQFQRLGPQQRNILQ
jgi:hypothetical protein